MFTMYARVYRNCVLVRKVVTSAALNTQVIKKLERWNNIWHLSFFKSSHTNDGRCKTRN